MKNTVIFICLFFLTAAQLLAQEKLQVELKGELKPDVYIDGKKYDHAIYDLLDQSKIESVMVIKSEDALKNYDAPNGVIIIKTKKAASQIENSSDTKVNIVGSVLEPVIVIDGKISTKAVLSDMSPNDIKSIKVVKGQEAIEQYSAANGAIVISTKKKDKPTIKKM